MKDYHRGQKFIDKWGKIWTLEIDENNEWVVYNNKSGIGLWRNQEGLKRYYPKVGLLTRS